MTLHISYLILSKKCANREMSQYSNNYFHMTILSQNYGTGVETTRVSIIPDGNYTSQDLIDKINHGVGC